MIEPVFMDLYKVETLSLGKRMFIVSQTPCYSIVDNGRFIVEMNPAGRFYIDYDGNGRETPVKIDEVMCCLRDSPHAIDREVLDWLLFNLEMFT